MYHGRFVTVAEHDIEEKRGRDSERLSASLSTRY